MKRTTLKKTPLKRKTVSATLRGSKRPLGGVKNASSRKGALKNKKAPTISKLKKELDRVFSLYIRAKYKKECYTCGYVGPLQCGHFVSRQYLSVRWDENNARPQCAMCNIWGRGMVLDFEENLKNELGDVLVESLKERRKEVTKLTREYYLENIARYKVLLETI